MKHIINLNRDCPNAIITEHNLQCDATIDTDAVYVVNCLLADRTYDQPLQNIINKNKKIIIVGCINKHTQRFAADVENIIPYQNDKYINIAAPVNYLSYGNIIVCRATNGCKGNCAYCNLAENRLSSYSVEQIKHSIINHLSNRITSILLYGNDITHYRDEQCDIFDLIEEIYKSFKLPITIACIPPSFIIKHYDVIKPLIQKGYFKSIGASMQSANKAVLNNMNRPVDLQTIYDIFTDINNIKPQNTFTYSEFIYGFYGETKETLYDSLKFATVFDYVVWYRYVQLVGSYASIKYSDLIIGKDYSDFIYDFAVITKNKPLKITKHKDFILSSTLEYNNKNINWLIF